MAGQWPGAVTNTGQKSARGGSLLRYSRSVAARKQANHGQTFSISRGLISATPIHRAGNRGSVSPEGQLYFFRQALTA